MLQKRKRRSGRPSKNDETYGWRKSLVYTSGKLPDYWQKIAVEKIQIER